MGYSFASKSNKVGANLGHWISLEGPLLNDYVTVTQRPDRNVKSVKPFCGTGRKLCEVTPD